MIARMLPALLLAAAAVFDHSHATWTTQLGRFVHDGVVDYAGWKKAEPALDEYLRELVVVKRKAFASFTRPEQLAFLIDAYNAYTVKTVLDHYPLSSIRAIGLLPGAAFRRSFIPLLDEELSLNDVEGRLRDLRDPRIHCALVCASKSCPRLRSSAYRGSELDAQLDEAARGFLGDPAKNRFEPGVARLSAIFKWYADDFRAGAGSVVGWVNRYAPVQLPPGARPQYLDYDWSLNGR